MTELDAVAARLPRRATLLDVGTGLGDIPSSARALARRRGIELSTFGLEAAEWLAAAGRPATSAAIVGDGRALPFADGSVDVVICSQVLHHFVNDDALRLIRELDRVARVRVIISDLRRASLAVAGLWASSWLLGFHPVSRHDGIVSIRRGFTAGELADTVREAIGREASVRRHLGFRVTASWSSAHATEPVGV
jgi:SAM-dependent methyltransferase